MIVLQASTHEDTVISILSEVDVELGNVGVELSRRRSGESETRKVQTITHRIGVRVWIGLEHLQHSGIGSGPERAASIRPAIWIKTGELLRAQRYHLCRIGAVCGLSRATSQIRDHALSQVVAGHDAECLEVFAGALPFIRRKKENSVLLNGSAESRSKGVADQVWWLVWLPGVQLGLLVEPIVGFTNARTVVFVGAAMPVVGATFRDQIYLCP